MGGSSSTLTSSQVNTFLQQQTTNFATSSSQSVSASGSVSQTITLANSTFNNCRVGLVNTAQLSVQSEGSLSTQSTASLTASLQAAANNAIQQASTQSNGWLATGSNTTNQTTDIQNTVSSIINTTISSSTVQNILAQASGTQLINGSGMNVTCDPRYTKSGPCGPDGSTGCDFMFNQSILVSATAKGIADAVTSALQNNSVVGSFINTSDQSAQQSNAGLPDPTGMLIVCIVFFILVFCSFALGMGLIFMSK